MVRQIGKVTIYVKDQEAAKSFWVDQVGFVVKLEQPMGPGMTWLEVGPSKESFTTFVLYNKETMQEQNPDINVGHPSVLLSTDDIETSYKEFKEKGIQVGELTKMPYGSMFQFFDNDGNTYLLREDRIDS